MTTTQAIFAGFSITVGIMAIVGLFHAIVTTYGYKVFIPLAFLATWAGIAMVLLRWM